MAGNRKEAAKTAASHHTTLCLLDAIANLAQGSDMHHTAQRTGERIAALCRAEQQRQLKRYDAQLARACGVDVPLAPSSGWIPWAGGPRPVPEEAVVFALRRDGTVNVFGLFARVIGWEWDTHKWSKHLNVVAYYVVTEDVGTLSAAPHISSVPPPPRADGVKGLDATKPCAHSSAGGWPLPARCERCGDQREQCDNGRAAGVGADVCPHCKTEAGMHHNCPVAGPVWTPQELAAAKERAADYKDFLRPCGVGGTDGR